jgi:hypothetical protein
MRCAPLLSAGLNLAGDASIAFAENFGVQELTNVAQLRHLPGAKQPANYRARLEGDALTAVNHSSSVAAAWRKIL